MFGVDQDAQEQVVVDWEGWNAKEDGLLERVKAVSQRISKRVRDVLGEETAEHVPLDLNSRPSEPPGAKD
jgi:hypothetical protein